MKINYNVSAAIANKNLLGIEDNLSQAMERLSSGLKLNHSKDSPTGMAISGKMQAQIDGLDRASQNASDGISVLQIADGALNETTSILQRMRELAVQAASDATMTPADRKAIQDEITSLKEEIDRISTDTEYNSKPLLDGSLDTRVYAQHVTRIDVSDYVSEGTYRLKIDVCASQPATIETGSKDYNDTVTPLGTAGVLEINGAKVEFTGTESMAEAYEKIRTAAEYGEVTVKRDSTGKLSFTADAYGKDSQIKLTTDSKELAEALALGTNQIVTGEWIKCGDVFIYGQTVLDEDGNPVVLLPTGEDAEVKLTDGFNGTATIRTEGNKITVSDSDGFSLSFLADAGHQGEIAFDVTDMGTMVLHIGANMDQNMQMRLQEVSCKSLYIDDVTVTTVNGASRALTSLDNAIAKVSEVRSRLGAYQNRLEYSVESLDTFEENMTGAMSRIADADMAEEMTNYTHLNVLNQAAISVLTQANDLPQQVLQILQ